MKIIKVSDATYRAIAAATLNGFGFKSTGTRQADGSWLVPLEDDTYERIRQQRLPGENDDDTIARLLNRRRPLS